MPTMSPEVASSLSILYLIIDYAVKIVAIGIVPENRRPSSSTAWLLLILVLPVVGLPLFILLGSPYVHGRRNQIQAEANSALADGLRHLPDLPPDAAAPPGLKSIICLNRRLTSLPCVTGINYGIESDYDASIRRMAAAVDQATRYVHVEIYIVAWDHATDVFFTALANAVKRGVKVRLLYDDIGSRKYPGSRALRRRLTAAGIEWYLMMPIQLLKGRFRRPDLRNHRKLVVIDGEIAFLGSQNMIDASYLSRANVKTGRRWNDVMVKLGGRIVASVEAVFAVDWFTESGERLLPELIVTHRHDLPIGAEVNAFQVVPSGPGFATEPNLRLFTSLLHLAQDRVAIVSPYFIPDESLFAAITTAAYRGVQIELFVSEQADQFMVDHAQSSYYSALLEAGVRIFRLPKPAVLHSKFMVIDNLVAVFGSSNLDMRSFGLDYEITLLGFDGDFVESLYDVIGKYHLSCKELTIEQWRRRPWPQRYLDNVFRLTSSLQ